MLPTAKSFFSGAFALSSRLHYYGSLFNAVEINSTFYKNPQPSTFEKWSLDVPGNFQFTLKISREITHVKNIEFNKDEISKFLIAANFIGSKKGCLLLQYIAKNEVNKIFKL